MLNKVTAGCIGNGDAAEREQQGDISQQMISLLTRCNDVVKDLSGLLGYLPYLPFDHPSLFSLSIKTPLLLAHYILPVADKIASGIQLLSEAPPPPGHVIYAICF
ncbi:hypothetical protein MLD38_040557 [Melastoma candidum]|nr:hypothetical protein MLD38_040557 [Melastoma candidum]